MNTESLNYYNKCRVLVIGVLLTLVAVYFNTFMGLVGSWLSQDDYAHGFLIPLISIYFIYVERDRLREIVVRPAFYSGLFVLLLGCLMFIMGERGGIVTVERVSLIVVIMGLVLLISGWNFFLNVLFPILYLLLMIPIVNLSSETFHWPFQLMTATLACKALSLFNVPVLQFQNMIQLPNITLEVANICSGARFFLSIIAIALPLAYFTQKKTWRRVLLVVVAIIISIVANAVRVALIGLWAYYTGRNGDIHGPFHVLQGLFVSVVGYVVLFLFSITFVEKGSSSNVVQEAKGNNVRHYNVSVSVIRASYVAMIILAGVFIYTNLIPLRVIPEGDYSIRMPLTAGTWLSVTPAKMQRLPGADKESNSAYRDKQGKEIGVYRGYFSFQKQGKECVESSSNWGKLNPEEIEIRLPTGETARVNKVLYSEEGRKYLAFYWYDLDGRTISGKYQAKALTAWNGMAQNRNNGAVMLVYRRIDDTEGADSAAADLKGFLKETGFFDRQAGKSATSPTTL